MVVAVVVVFKVVHDVVVVGWFRRGGRGGRRVVGRRGARRGGRRWGLPWWSSGRGSGRRVGVVLRTVDTIGVELTLVVAVNDARVDAGVVAVRVVQAVVDTAVVMLAVVVDGSTSWSFPRSTFAWSSSR